MSSSIVSPQLAQPKVRYQPNHPEAQRALDVVLKAYPTEHLCCYGHEAGVAQIGYWRRGTGLLGPNHFVALGEGCILDEAVLDAARKITHPLTLIAKPTATELALHEMAEAMARAACPFCAERPNAQVIGGAVDPTPRMNYQANPDVPIYWHYIYWHYYVATDTPARPCVAQKGETVLTEEAASTEAVSPQKAADARQSGFIREWRDEGRGFGKIYSKRPDSQEPGAQQGEYFFFHMSSVTNVRALAQGVAVRFDIAPIQRGKHRRAVNVEVVG